MRNRDSWAVVRRTDRCDEHVGHCVLRVANKRHRRLGTERFDTTGKRLFGHVVLHDVHKCLVSSLALASELVKATQSQYPTSPIL